MPLSTPRENKRALLLVTPPIRGTFHNDNHDRLSLAFAKQGYDVHRQPHDKLCLTNGKPYIGEYPLDSFELIWPVGFGPQRAYLDRLGIMNLADAGRFISPPQTVFSFHNKARWLEFAPETHMSNDAATLAKIVQEGEGEGEGGVWVLKPATGSFGRDVVKITHATEVHERMAGVNSAYWLLQHYVDDIALGEYRTLIACDQIIGTYLRKPKAGFHANLSQGASASVAELPANHSAIVKATHQSLRAAQIGFAAIDTCGGYVLEVNVANPGGLGTLDDLYGGCSADRVVDSLLTRSL